MPYTIRFLEHPTLHETSKDIGRHYDGTVDFSKFSIGDMAYYHYRGQPCKDKSQLSFLPLTKHYWAVNSGRPPLILALPDKPKGTLYFMVDGQCYSSQCIKCGQKRTGCKCGTLYVPKGYYDGWTVSGAPPQITVSPSVNYDDDERGVKHYHGFIANGVIGPG
jgi:hypothetical protein